MQQGQGVSMHSSCPGFGRVVHGRDACGGPVRTGLGFRVRTQTVSKRLWCLRDDGIVIAGQEGSGTWSVELLRAAVATPRAGVLYGQECVQDGSRAGWQP